MKALVVISLLLSIQLPASHAQISQLMGIDTSQSLGNFDYVFGTTTLNGNIWMAARCERTLTVSGGQVHNYGTLLQMSPAGNIITSQKSGFRSIHSVVTATDGNLVVCGEGSGFFCTSGMCKSDMLVAKVSSNYSVIWGRSFGNPNYNGTDGAKRVFETADSNIVVVGNMYESSNNSHPFIAKMNGATGDTIWTRALGYPMNQFGNDASEGPNGEIFLGVSGDLRVFKLDADGTPIWSNGFANYGQVMRVFAQPDGSVIAAGQYLSAGGDYSICLFKISGAGTLEWFNDYNTSLPDHNEFINDVIYDNGSFYIGGYHYSTPNYTGFYPLLIKTDILGNLDWALEHSTVNGEVKSLMMHGGNLLCGLDYTPPLLNNMPDLLLTEINTNGLGNGCFTPHPMAMTFPTVNTYTYGTWSYTDFETQVTIIAFSNQNYWRTPECVSTGLQSETSHNPFELLQQNGELIIKPAAQDPYTLEVSDVAGRRLIYYEKLSGEQSVSLNKYSGQILFITLGELNHNNVTITSKFFVE